VEELHVTFTDKTVSAWGGMKLMNDMLNSIGMKDFLSKLDLPEKGSNGGYESVQIIECFWTSIWIGASRFSHSALLYDKVLHEIPSKKE
jgi:hypothetical protein